jgi:hypothetical protein
MKMDKTKIKEVKFSHEKKSIFIEFLDGSKYGETGNTALKTFKQLNDNNVSYVELDLKVNKNGKS